MTQADLNYFRRLLLQLKKRLGSELSGLEEEALRPVGGEAAGGLSDVPVHPADLGTEVYDQEVALTLLEKEQQMLQDVEDALERIEQGTYGRCENCQREISRERLQIVPYTRYCAECAHKLLATKK